MKNTRALIEGAILISIFAIISLLVVYLPLLGAILLFALPLPIILYTIRHGLKPGIWMGLASLPVSFIVSSFAGLTGAFTAACTGVAMGYYFKKKQPGYAVAAGAIACMLCGVVIFVFSIVFLNMNVVDNTMSQLRESLSLAETMSKQLGYGDQFGKQTKLMERQLSTLQYLFPTALILISIVSAFLSYAMARPFLRRFFPDLPKMKPFRELRLPQVVVILYFVVTILGFLHLEKGHMMYSVSLNGGYILNLLICIQGLAFIFFYCHEMEMPKAVPVLAIVLGVLFPLIMSVYLLLGIIDIGFNIRNKVTRN
ncbi:YybS family protein [Bacillus siamensis]|uniref:YybS family protein n=1 Tax=Bacillus siamensis TaxID=659243 RepID=UPI002DB66CD1|nr:YybS family protein [Bacillus siamensis]MEC3655816.1 YybS family protein [Bacillus siamensis]